MPLFERVIVANRGEIAHRIFRTCRRLGIATVAVAPEDDAETLHVRSADAVARVGSYLAADEIIAAAHTSGATAVHPGYGFLAEQAEFARSVEAAGLVWIGPPPPALGLAGDKLAALDVAARSGVPTLASGEPDELGYPLIVKAAAGGGGRGMRVVREAAALDDAIEAARREAMAAFGEDSIYFERFVEGCAPRRGAAACRLPRRDPGARRARLLRAEAASEADRRVAELGTRAAAARAARNLRNDARSSGRLPERRDG